MDSRSGTLAVLVFTLSVSMTATAAEWRLGHSPIQGAPRAESLEVHAHIDGQLRAEPELTLYYAYDAGRYVSMDLHRRGANSYVARIPASATAGRELRYYIVSRADNTVRRIGSAREPVRVALYESASTSPAGTIGLAFGLATFLLGGELLVGWWSGLVRRRNEVHASPRPMTLTPVGRLYGGSPTRRPQSGLSGPRNGRR